jgi:dephospho-CoA kinase
MEGFLVIGVVGLQGAGKTEVARAAAKLGIPSIHMGEAVIEEVMRRKIELTEANVGETANDLRRLEGPAAIAKRCLPKILRAGEGAKAVLVDGIRSEAEVEEFERAFGDRFFLIAVEAGEQTRYRRVMGRRRLDDASSFEEFIRRDERELKWGLAGAMARADFVLKNEGSIEELHEKVTGVMQKLISGEAKDIP